MSNSSDGDKKRHPAVQEWLNGNSSARSVIDLLELALHKLEMEMPDYKECCALREKAERENTRLRRTGEDTNAANTILRVRLETTERERAEANRLLKLADGPMLEHAEAALAAWSPLAAPDPVLNKPAQVGATRFGVGIKWSTVIDRAQREWDYFKGLKNPRSSDIDADPAPLSPLSHTGEPISASDGNGQDATHATHATHATQVPISSTATPTFDALRAVAELYDGPGVYTNLTERELTYTTPQNVSAVLDALVRLIRKNPERRSTRLPVGHALVLDDLPFYDGLAQQWGCTTDEAARRYRACVFAGRMNYGALDVRGKTT